MDYITKAVTDADAADWITVAAYLVAAGLSWRAACWAYPRSEKRARLFWNCSFAAMLFLGMNELLDLQTLLTAAGRMAAQSQGWYEERRPIQFAFIIALAVLALAASIATIVFVKDMAKPVKLALAGYIFIGVFVLFRAASIHHLDELLGSGFQAFNLGSMQEMTGIVVVGLASVIYVHRARQHGTVKQKGR